MRIKHIALFAVAALVSLSSSAAPQGASGEEVVTVSAAPAKAYVDPMMAKRMQGVYVFDDGSLLRVTGKSRKFYADVGNGPVEIVHVGGDRFEAIGQDLSLRFEGAPFPDTVELRNGARHRIASAQR